MAPQLFHRQLEHGAWGITLAVPHQVRVAREFGVPRIFLANELVDAAALRWIAGELAADPGFRFVAYVDSVRGVELMDAALRGCARPVDVVVELGAGDGARTGVRTEADARAVAEAVGRASGTLRLVGVAGYEGEVPRPDPERVRAYLRRLVALAAGLDRAGLFKGAQEIVVSAGGSGWFDSVAEVFAEIPELSAPVLKLLRSGAYVSHDDGHYRRITPFARVPEEGALEPAFRLWAQVVSRPTPEQAFANAGKRDAAYDLDLPAAQVVRRGEVERPADGITVTGLSDQHAWLRTEPGADVEVGDWIGLGLSHPCTSFDKWQLIPVAEADGTVVDFIRTYF
jgi:D-serine deaminase-like pyridoxal phosphate-dependent protein